MRAQADRAPNKLSLPPPGRGGLDHANKSRPTVPSITKDPNERYFSVFRLAVPPARNACVRQLPITRYPPNLLNGSVRVCWGW